MEYEEVVDKSIRPKDSPYENDPKIFADLMEEIKEHVENAESDCLKLEKDNQNIEILNSLFRSFHSIKGLCGFIKLPLIQEIAHKTETLLDRYRKHKIPIEKSIIDIVLHSIDKINLMHSDYELSSNNLFKETIKEFLDKLDFKISQFKEVEDLEKLDETSDDVELSQWNYITEENIEDTCQHKTQKELESKSISNFTTQPKTTISKTKKQDIELYSESLNLSTVNKRESFLKFSAKDLNTLSELMGEILILQSLIEREMNTLEYKNDFFKKELMQIGKLTTEVQTLTMSLGMVPLKNNFQKLIKVINETSRSLGKNINLHILGESTEMERELADRITDSLMHVVKNSIAHGIEKEEERVANGKSKEGNLKIEAYAKSEHIYIEISDDGKGINTEKILKKAIDKNIAQKDIEYTEEEILDFIFKAGFSTEENINSVSGRGVGLDVVKTEITRIGGKVHIKNSIGKGCTFVIQTPLNLSVLDGTVVNIKNDKYIIPTVNLSTILKAGDYNWIKEQGKRTKIRVGEEIIPLIPREKIFGQDYESDKDFEKKCILILTLRGKKRALVVENISERRKVAVKSIENLPYKKEFIMSASILDDGKVAFIVEVESIFRMGAE